jgi:hypothetical protein
MSLTVIPFHYYETAKKEYENGNDNDNENGNDNDNENGNDNDNENGNDNDNENGNENGNDNGGYKFELICEYAKWLYIMNECIRIWE